MKRNSQSAFDGAWAKGNGEGSGFVWAAIVARGLPGVTRRLMEWQDGRRIVTSYGMGQWEGKGMDVIDVEYNVKGSGQKEDFLKGKGVGHP